MLQLSKQKGNLKKTMGLKPERFVLEFLIFPLLAKWVVQATTFWALVFLKMEKITHFQGCY